MKKLKTLAPILGVLAVIVALFVWGVMSQSGTAYVPNTQVACLPNGHQNLVDHIHPTIAITVDGVPETVPANIGITPNCMAEVHTHEADGVIHIETTTSGRLANLTLADFFAVWQKPFLREGYTQKLMVDGQEAADLASVHFRDDQQIAVVYISIAQ